MGKSDVLSQQTDRGTESQDNWYIVLLKLEFLPVWVLEGLVVKGKEKVLLKNIW